MTGFPSVFPQLELRIINESKLCVVNDAVPIVLMHIRKYMQDIGWPEEAQLEADPAVEAFNHLLCKLDYAKIRMQAGLIPSKKPYCEECTCKAHDKDFTCPYPKNNADCVLLSIAKRLKGDGYDL